LYIITQFYKDNGINDKVQTLLSYNPKQLVVFTDTRVRNENFNILPKNAPLRWNQVFDFILNNNFLNNEGCYILEPDFNGNLPKYSKDGIYFFHKGIYVKNIKKSYNIKRRIFTDYEFLRVNINGISFKVASICHLYYEDLLEEYIDKLNELKNSDLEIDYYFSLTENNSTNGQKKWVKDKLEQHFTGCKIFVLPNKGLDIGPFLYILDKIPMYDYILKTHTKKSIKTSGEYFGTKWRNNLLEILDISKIKPHIENGEYMIASKKWLVDSERYNFNINKVNFLKEELCIKIDNSKFVGGTMFWVKHSLIKKYIKHPMMYYNMLENGYHYQIDHNDQEYFTHSFERVFGHLVYNEGKKIIGI
jgi:lipopolysaccharide biosynthesis protein